jgi:RNA polymerase sigma-70 factor, ECF subfamily
LHWPATPFTIKVADGHFSEAVVEHFQEAEEADALLQQAEGGDPGAVNRLLQMHERELLRYIGVRLPTRLRPRVDAADVVQEAFAEATRRFPEFLRERPLPFRLWLLQIGRDRLYMETRKHLHAARRSVARELTISDESSIRLSSLLPATGSTPSRRVRREEAADKVRTALGMLEESDHEIILSRMMDDLSYADIGLLQGCTAVSARKRFSRALERLCDALVSLGWNDHDRAG